jgi:hypothetical protein
VSAAVESRSPVSGVVRLGSARARAWNQQIRAVVRPDTLGELPFFCECGTESCGCRVWLTLEEVRDLIECGESITGGHFSCEPEARRDLQERP